MSQKYKVLRTFAKADGNGGWITVKHGGVVELEADEAKRLAKINAIGLYFDDDEEEAPPKPKRRRGRPRKSVETVQNGT